LATHFLPGFRTPAAGLEIQHGSQTHLSALLLVTYECVTDPGR